MIKPKLNYEEITRYKENGLLDSLLESLNLKAEDAIEALLYHIGLQEDEIEHLEGLCDYYSDKLDTYEEDN